MAIIRHRFLRGKLLSVSGSDGVRFTELRSAGKCVFANGWNLNIISIGETKLQKSSCRCRYIILVVNVSEPNLLKWMVWKRFFLFPGAYSQVPC